MNPRMLRGLALVVVAIACLVPVTGWSQTVLMGPAINNGSFETIDPHTASITNTTGRRAATSGTFIVGGATLTQGTWQFSTLGFGGVDSISTGGGPHDGSEVMIARFGTVLSGESGPIATEVEIGDVFTLSAWTIGDLIGATFDYTLGVRFDGGPTVPILTGTHWNVSPIAWIPRTAAPFVSSVSATSVQVVAVISNNTGDRFGMDDIVLEQDGLAGGKVVITAHPQDAVRVLGDTNAVSVFSVAATSKQPPLTYQWRQDGVALTGETNGTLSLVNADIKNYDVVVTSDSLLSATSQPATVSEILPPLDPGDQSVSLGDPVTLSMTMGTGSPYTFQWFLDDLAVAGTSATYSMPAADFADQGFYTLKVTYDGRTLTSDRAGLAVSPVGTRYLMAPTFNNGSFEVIHPHTAPISDESGRRASQYYFAFSVANWSIVPVNGPFGIDDTAITNTLPRRAQQGDLAAMANTYASGAFLSDPIPVDMADGHRFQVSMFSGGDKVPTDFDVTVELLFDAEPPLTIVNYTETTAQDWVEHNGVHHRTSGVATSVQVRLTLDNATGDWAKSHVDNIVLDQSAASGQVTIEQQPENLTVDEGRLATFSSEVSGDGQIDMQWERNGSPLPGATNASLEFAATLADDQSVYRLYATNVVLSTVYATSSVPAVLTVVQDLTPPTVLSVSYLPTNQVAVRFSEPVAEATATNLANYVLSGPSGTVVIVGAVLNSAGDLVTLQTVPLERGGLFTLSLSGIQDPSTAGNLIASGTESSFDVPFYPDPLLYLPFDETTGSVAHDLSGNGLDGRLRYGASFAPGKINNGILFQGGGDAAVGDYVSVSDSPLLNFNGKSFTAAWYTQDISDDGWALAKGKGGARGWGYGSTRFTTSDWDGPDTTVGFGATGNGGWIHQAVTVDATQRLMTSYRDGHVIEQVSIPVDRDLNDINEPTAFTVGARGGGYSPFFTGMIDEVYLWDVVLTPSQILHLVDDSPPAESTTIEYIATDEEFVGPFPSWRNVRTDYGAVGDGIADDTAALQAAFADQRLMISNDYSVLYVPSGTYRITATITTTDRSAHEDYLGATVIGEHPTNTVIVWDGPSGQDMLHWDSWFSKISRLTLDGRNRANSGLRKGGQFSTYCEVSDMHFIDLKYGILLGGPNGQAEHTVQRCRFTRCWDAGVVTADWNSLDLWVWDCLFEDCYSGCYTQEGNYHVWRSVFLRSKGADLRSDNLMTFSAVGNTSIGSGSFIDWTSGHSHGSPMLIQNNRVFDVAGNRAITLGNSGPFVLIDNQFKNRAADTNAAVSLSGGDNVLLGNTYTVPDPVIDRGRFRNVDQQIVSPVSLPTPLTVQLPQTPPNRVRTVFEVQHGTGDDDVEIQSKIDAAAAEPYGSRPVVHIPDGRFLIDQTLVVPAGRDIQILGDDGAINGSEIHWSIATPGLIMRLEGPSRARISSLSLMGGAYSPAGCLLITEADQVGGRVHAMQINASGAHPGSYADNLIFIDGVEDSDVTLLNNGVSYFANTAIHVTGGAKRRQGLATGGQISIFGGATGTSDTAYKVTHGGKLYVQSVYHEIGGNWMDVHNVFTLNHRGALTIANTKFGYSSEASTPTYLVNGHDGRLTLLANLMSPVAGSAPSQWSSLTGDGSKMQVCFLANKFPVKGLQPDGNYVDTNYIFRDSTTPVGDNAFLYCNADASIPTYSPFGTSTYRLDPVYNNVLGAEPSDQFLRDALVDLRNARRELPLERPLGVTDVKLNRIMCSSGEGLNVIHIQGTPIPYTLTVVSEHGGASPETITNNAGTVVDCVVTNSPVVVLPGSTRYVCVGGNVVGNDFTVLNPTHVTLTLTNDATLTWQWETHYWLNTDSTGPGSIAPALGWYPAGTNLAITASASNYYHFTGWTGTVSSVTNPLPVTMNMPYSLGTEFAPNLVTNGVPEWWLALNGWTNDFMVAALSDQDGDGRITADEWVADTVPTNWHSALEASINASDGDDIIIQWKGGSLASQYLEYAEDLAISNEAWQVLLTNRPPTAVSNNYIHGAVTNGSLYYRIRAVRP